MDDALHDSWVKRLEAKALVSRRSASRLLGRARSYANSSLRPGRRTVLLTPPAMGFGNHLYMWLWAHIQGSGATVLFDPRMRDWVMKFPALQDLTVPRESIRVWDKRVVLWGQQVGRDYSMAQLEGFVRERLLSNGSYLESLIGRGRPPLDEVVLNVRRGDFYNSRFGPLYSFNIDAYLKEALRLQLQLGSIRSVVVVTDDTAWCRRNLAWLGEFGSVSYAPPGEPAIHLRMLGSASRLILSNSTFAYWGAHIAGLAGADRSHIVAPWFHSRQDYGGAAYQLDPRWRVVKEIQGGWGPAA